MSLEELDAFLEEDHVDFFQIVVRRDHALAVVIGVGVLGQRRTVQKRCRRHGHAVSVDPGVEPVGRRAGDGSEEAVKPAVDRAIRYPLRKVNPPDTFHARPAPLLASFRG